jgi:AhpD family alkylhydroperoxidase
MATTDFPELNTRLLRGINRLRESAPGTMGGIAEMAGAASSDGALDAKTKELIALAISVAIRSDNCIAFHARAAVELGATRDEAEEAIAMALYLGGGSVTLAAADALDAFDQFSAHPGRTS